MLCGIGYICIPVIGAQPTPTIGNVEDCNSVENILKYARQKGMDRAIFRATSLYHKQCWRICPGLEIINVADFLSH